MGEVEKEAGEGLVALEGCTVALGKRVERGVASVAMEADRVVVDMEAAELVDEKEEEPEVDLVAADLAEVAQAVGWVVDWAVEQEVDLVERMAVAVLVAGLDMKEEDLVLERLLFYLEN